MEIEEEKEKKVLTKPKERGPAPAGKAEEGSARAVVLAVATAEDGGDAMAAAGPGG